MAERKCDWARRGRGWGVACTGAQTKVVHGAPAISCIALHCKCVYLLRSAYCLPASSKCSQSGPPAYAQVASRFLPPFLQDPVRKEVPDAVAACQRAGITVRMVTGQQRTQACHWAREGRVPVGSSAQTQAGAQQAALVKAASTHLPTPTTNQPKSSAITHSRIPTPADSPAPRFCTAPHIACAAGDNIHTAKHIARECGILTDEGLAMEGPDFRRMPEEEILQLLPKLQVLGV